MARVRLAAGAECRETRRRPRARHPRIHLMGHVTGEELARAYRDADAFVLPSLYEPWGLVVHEALAYGLPVITTDQVGAGDDLIERDVNGYVVAAGSADELREAMSAVARWTPAQREEGSRRSTERLASFSIERGADGFVRGCTLALEHRKQTGRLSA